MPETAPGRPAPQAKIPRSVASGYSPDGKLWTNYSGSMDVTKPNASGTTPASAFCPGATNYVRSVLKDVIVEAHVGLHPWEQHPQRPSRLIVNVEMFATLNSGRL